MAALAGLGPLGHFDLDLFRADQIAAGDAEAAGGHLLDGGVAVGAQAGGVLAALAGVGLAPDGVHGLGQTFVGFQGDGAVGHGPGLEAAEDRLDGLHLFQGDGGAVGAEVHQVPEGEGGAVGQGRVGLERLIAAAADGLLQGQDGLGVIAVDLGVGAAAELLEAAAVDGGVGGQLHGVEGGVVALGHGGGDVRKADAAHAADGVGEVAVDDVLVDAHRLEDLGALIGLDGGDAHLGGNAHHAAQNGQVIIVHGGGVVLVQQVLVDELPDGFVGQVGVYGAGTVAQQGGEMMHVPRLAALQNDGDGGALFRADEVLLQGRHGQEGGDGHVVFVDAPVREDDDVGPLPVDPVAADEKMVQRPLQRGVFVI